MSTQVTWNGVNYSIPAAGEANWSTLSDFLIALGNGAATSGTAVQGIRVATTTPVAVSSVTDCTLLTNLTVAGPVAINLPLGSAGKIFIIKDAKGDAATNNVTITPYGTNTISTASSLVLNQNNEAVYIQFVGGDWKVVLDIVQPGTIRNDDVAYDASIDRSKIASGANNNVLINSPAGVMSSEATLAKTRGGAGADMTNVTFPSTGVLVTESGNSTLTNKTFTAPVQTTYEDITQVAAPSAPAAGKVRLYANSNDAKLHAVTPDGTDQVIGSGSGGSSVPNYILQGQFEDNTATDWIVYYNAGDTTTPTLSKGYGGTNAFVSKAVQASTYFGSTKALRISYAGGTIAEGAGVSYGNSAGFFVGNIDRNKPMMISFDYNNTAASGEVGVFLYDVTNDKLITPSITSLPAGVGTFQAFAVLSSGSNYRLCFHLVGIATTAWTLDIDNVNFGRQVVALGSAIGAWKSFTPTGSWSTNTTYTGKYCEIGDSIKVMVKLALAGAPTSAGLTVNIPSGFTIDTTKLNGTTNQSLISSTAQTICAGNLYDLLCDYNSTTSVRLVAKGASGTYVTEPTQVTQAVPATFANNDYITLSYSVPVNELSANVTLANRALEEIASYDGAAISRSPSGSLIPNQGVGTSVIHTLSFISIPQITDCLFLELYVPGNGWSPASNLYPWSQQNTNTYGIRIYWSSTTNLLVTFAGGGVEPNSTFGSNSSVPWSTLYGAGYRYRVRKVSSGASVGFPISSANIVGRTDGVAPSPNMVGQVLTGTIDTTAISSGGYRNMSSIVLPVGTWQVFGNAQITAASETAHSWSTASISTTSGNADPLTQAYNDSTVLNVTKHLVPCSMNITTSGTTVYLVFGANFSGGTNTPIAAGSQFYAVRIA